MHGFRVAPMKKVRVGVIGVGGRGAPAAHRIAQIPGCEVTAISEKDKKVTVQAGILKAKVDISALRLLEKGQKVKVKEPKPEARIRAAVKADFHPEVDVRGMIGDDAWFVVDKYLDDAVLAGVPSVRIIHGKGTGALRAALWKYFKTDRRIKSYRHGEYGEGDAGVTVIEFKQ
jgi:DNA mismatch repair protein MutS2